jgi:hypothetical protein
VCFRAVGRPARAAHAAENRREQGHLAAALPERLQLPPARDQRLVGLGASASGASSS